MTLTEKQKQKIISFTKELVRIPGESGNEKLCAECVTGKMKELGYDEVTVDKYGTVLGLIRGEKKGPVLLFDGHMDVVPIREPEKWTHKPYGAETSQDKIWGRGTADMKGALAAMICAPAFLKRSEVSGKILVSASVAEEMLIGYALSSVLENHHIDAVIIGEPTALQPGTAEKGRAGIEMICHGTVAHSSRPDLGDNAVYRMMEAVKRIQAMPRRSHPFLGQEVIELVEISSLPSPGNGSIPGECRSLWECRLLHGETEKSFIDRWNKALEGLEKTELKIASCNLESYTGVRMEMDDFLPGWMSDENGFFCGLVKKAVLKYKQKIDLYAAPYGCNALVSAGIKKIPTVILGPGKIEAAHKPDENIEIDDLLKAAQIYSEIIKQFSLKTPDSMNAP